MSARPPSIPLFLLRLPSVLLCLHILTLDPSGADHCYDIGNFTAVGNYAKNRELVLSSLASNMASNGGFYSGKVGEGSDAVYVLGFCRGDSSNDTCFTCVSSGAKDLMINCPTQKAAFSRAGNPPCIIRYADRPIYGVKQTFPTVLLYNTGHIRMEQDQFDPIWTNLTEKLAANASMGTSQLKFAVGSTELPNLQTMFALLQCSPDLSRDDCHRCLLECINDYQGCCHGYQGGVVHKPSCIFRWDLYPFFESNPVNPLSSPPPPTAVAEADHCYDSGNFMAAGNYAKNRELVLSSLASNMASNGGFYSGKVGEGSDAVYVLGFCRGDSSNDTCFKCVSSGAKDLMINCPTQKAAFSRAGNPSCIIRYADRPIYGVKQTFPTVLLYNTGHIRMDQDQFDPIWRNLTEELAASASMGTSQLKFAVGSTELPNVQTMFALLQCSPDLSRDDCHRCLLECINDYQGCCHGYQGGVVHKPSCIFRWDLYPFFESNPVNPLSSPPPPTAVAEAHPPAPPANRANPPPSPPPRTAVAEDGHPAPPANAQVTYGNISQSLWIVDAVEGSGVNISKSLWIVRAVKGSGVLFMMVIVFARCFIRRRRTRPRNYIPLTTDVKEEVATAESLKLKISEIKAATNFFSEGNKLGEGGFGKVYWGKLENGQYIAAKRLVRYSDQGEQHFKNEATLLVGLQHNNLIQLHGYCLEEGERILILEFAPNGSLEGFISDSIKRVLLSWERRYSIIRGIARGLLYLHEDSGLRIIHRDLKPSNVLLDDNMNPKISDFGTSRLFDLDRSREKTTHVAGTFGYMAPEYLRSRLHRSSKYG